MSAIRNFCFTLNNWTEDERLKIETLPYQYLVYGKEKGEKGTPHLQGYCELKGKMRFSTLKDFIKRMHIEPRRGTAVQASDYCKKEGDVVELGSMKSQGKRTDLCAAIQVAEEDGLRGVSLLGNMQANHVARTYLTYHEEPRDWVTEVIWLWGPSGAGKSRRARELCDGDVFIKSEGSKWWDGYDGHEQVIIDDFRDSWWSLTDMLRLLDRYECRVEIKGGMRQFKPKKIVVTSLFGPGDCYKGTNECIVQLLRRITVSSYMSLYQK